MRKRIGIYGATDETRQLIPALLENNGIEIAAIFDPEAETSAALRLRATGRPRAGGAPAG